MPVVVYAEDGTRFDFKFTFPKPLFSEDASDLTMKGWRGLRFIFSKQFSVFGRFPTNFTSNDPQNIQLQGYLEAGKYSDVVYFHTVPLVIVDITK